MDKFKQVPEIANDAYAFWCGGCGMHHVIRTDENIKSHHKFNNNIEHPTIEPSIKVEIPHPEGNHICHSYITNGIIKYLNDCTHHLKGKELDLPNI